MNLNGGQLSNLRLVRPTGEPHLQRFIHQQNLISFRKQLTETKNEARRQQLLSLLSEEELKDDPLTKEKQVAVIPAMTAKGFAMNRITKSEVLRRLRERLTRTTDEAECKQIVNQIEEEEAKKPGR
jgi:hypothetical protein